MSESQPESTASLPTNQSLSASDTSRTEPDEKPGAEQPVDAGTPQTHASPDEQLAQSPDPRTNSGPGASFPAKPQLQDIEQRDSSKVNEERPSDRHRSSNRSGSHSRDDSRRNQNRRDNNKNKKRGGRKRNKRRNRNDDDGKERNEDESRHHQRQNESTIPSGPPTEAIGLVEISPKGFGFLRQEDRNFQQSPNDVFITPEIVRIHGLRDGIQIKCMAQQGNRGPQLTELLEINGGPPENYHDLPYFEELTAINPNKRYALETRPDCYTTRVIDMMTPIGRGQRGLIVAPPRTGKTTILHNIAEAILENYEDEVKLIVLLVDERPEEVTDFKRSLPGAEIMASSNDSNVKDHTRISQLAIERAKRMVEAGEHVFILLDSITRLARAFNNSTKGKGRGTATGGLAVGALEIPRKLFAAARNTREAGSLTIIATALIETNSRMDDAIFQEFKGTGNMELVLDRKIAQSYIYPAVDIHKSGTRREELLLASHMLEKVRIIRRGLAGHKPTEAMERLLSFLEKFPSNAQMLLEIKNP